MIPPQLANLTRTLPPKIVLTNRIIWAALIMGQLMFAAVILVIRSQQPAAANDEQLRLFGFTAAMMFLVTAPIAVLIPKFIIKRDADDVILAQQYASANIISMALLEGPSLFAIVVIFLTGAWWPVGLIPLIAIALQITRFPRATI